ncbi:MAG TPA: FtsX-like permease family protein [Edaphobacter sp.]|nr:FtsX-like permease family protein [Edaphobacter sp.]
MKSRSIHSAKDKIARTARLSAASLLLVITFSSGGREFRPPCLKSSVLALSLAMTGIFGLASYSVARRMRDFGIRLALGASRHSILNTALGRVAIIVFVGSSLGLLLGLASTRILAAIVYQAGASDPLVLAGVVGTMFAIGILSAILPARRALRIQPASLLRAE